VNTPIAEHPTLESLLRLTAEAGTSSSDYLRLEFAQRVLGRSRRYSGAVNYRVQPIADEILSADHVVVASALTLTGRSLIAESDVSTLFIEIWSDQGVVLVATSDETLTESIVRSLELTAKPAPQPETIRLNLWHTKFRPVQNSRRLPTEHWASIEENYPKVTRDHLADVMHLNQPGGSGQLMLWHGPAGTGKTTALRALMTEWEGWCKFHYITDPERFFDDPGYITEVMFPEQPIRDEDCQPTWRLIIVEDNDRFIRHNNARSNTDGLGRLLNLTDGILGQGYRNIVLLTTNEPLDRIHPALTRPGRCLASIEFDRFSPIEAANWLPDGLPIPNGPMTLAEMYESAKAHTRIGDFDDGVRPVGQYL